VLVEKKYADADDVLNFLGGVITMADELLREHIIWKRQDSQNSAIYATSSSLWNMRPRFHTRASTKGPTASALELSLRQMLSNPCVA
jgi:hypothetical protein